MSISVGFTAEEIRELVHQYEVLPYGQKLDWLAFRGLPYERMRRWRSAVFEGDLDRGLIPREGSPMTVPPKRRTALERQRARERAEHKAEVAKLNARVRQLEQTNEALGKAIGLLQQLNEQEPGAAPQPNVPPGSSNPTTGSSPS